ncbi:MAG: glycoside hydrolase family 95 protein [Oscillospiraceae bacterium]|nr:glycoside hydrolase family 95 protein [Oscillospiraceae bacterium]
MDRLSELLWYKSPAENWDEALPVGNGRLGGMIFGKPADELIQLNEDSIWSGSFRKRNNPKAYENLEKMRTLIREGKTAEAEALCSDAFYGTNEQQRHYHPLGDFHIWQGGADGYTDYKRSLDLENSVCETKWKSGGVSYSRTVFASCPDNVIVIRFAADQKGKISFTALIDGKDDDYDKNEAYDGNTLLFTMSDGVPYAAAISCSAKGGDYSNGGKPCCDANRISVANADEATITISCQTAFRTSDYEKLAISQAKAAIRKGFVNLMAWHAADYRALYERCAIDLCDNSNGNAELPTNERLQRLKDGEKDNKLTEMYFNFSRYLMISGSRTGTLPLNLQGIWNKDMWPAWGGKYTININTEMNYWGAEIQNLSECHTPLFDHIERMRENGRVTAREMYRCRGTMCHHNTDIWGDTAPQDKWLPGTLWPMGMAWLCTHLYEHYLFTGDKLFLAEKYDTIREAAEFFADFLIEDDKGRVITSPSVSPENTYITKDGAKGTICQGPSMDSQILHELFTAVIKCSEALDESVKTEDDKEFVEKIKSLRDRLPKPEVGKYGQIMEWAEDYDEAEPGHRHISQLFALYPYDLITKRHTPELAAAAEATLIRRLTHGGGHTGWSRAWIINMWARLGDGARVGENISALLAWSTNINMFDMHPPFQIDGNFGGGAGIAEALVQSHSGEISLLPAVPAEWESGSVRGMMARGGFELSFEWSGGKIARLEILSKCGNPCRIVGTGLTVTSGGESVSAKEIGDTTCFETEAGKTYDVTAWK